MKTFVLSNSFEKYETAAESEAECYKHTAHILPLKTRIALNDIEAHLCVNWAYHHQNKKSSQTLVWKTREKEFKSAAANKKS